MPLMKFSADLSLSVPVLAGYFTTSFSSNFVKLYRHNAVIRSNTV